MSNMFETRYVYVYIYMYIYIYISYMPIHVHIYTYIQNIYIYVYILMLLALFFVTLSNLLVIGCKCSDRSSGELLYLFRSRAGVRVEIWNVTLRQSVDLWCHIEFAFRLPMYDMFSPTASLTLYTDCSSANAGLSSIRYQQRKKQSSICHTLSRAEARGRGQIAPN